MDSPDSYVTVEEASSYLSGRPNTGAWDKATPEQRTGALLEASDLIDSYRWQGLPLTKEQARPWPRSGVDVGSIQIVRRAVILEALALLQPLTLDATGQMRLELQRQGVTSFRNGPLSETYKDSAMTRQASGLQSQSALKILRPYMVTGGRVI